MGSSLCKVNPTTVDVITSGPEPVCAAKDKEEIIDDLKRVATRMVINNWMTNDDAETQLTAIEKFRNGQMSYAEMRMLAG